MRLLLATLCFNEMEWLPLLFEQHRRWPDLVHWVFVEAVDRVYAEQNPDLITFDGRSVDGTSTYLDRLAEEFPALVTVVKCGVVGSENREQGKCEARNRYLQVADEIKPDYIFALDADEFFTHEHQAEINRLMLANTNSTGFCFRHRTIWCPPILQTGTGVAEQCELEAVGSMWSLPNCQGWLWREGMRHWDTHSRPEYLLPGGGWQDAGIGMAEFWRDTSTPQCVHMGWASEAKWRLAKIRYYKDRGGGLPEKQAEYRGCRDVWETWNPSVKLPYGAQVIPYTGPVPGVFR